MNQPWGGGERYVPVPVSGTVCGLPPPLSSIPRVADRAPCALGWKITAMVQLAPAASLAGQAFTSEKSLASGPTMPIPLMFMEPLPSLTTTTFWDGLIDPTFKSPKLRLLGEMETMVAAPERLTICGLPPPLSAIARYPVSVPVIV